MYCRIKVGFATVALLAQSCSSNSPVAITPAQATPGNFRKVPTSWIEKIRQYNYKQDSRPLLAELEGFIRPDTLDGTSKLPHVGGFPHLDKGLQNPEDLGGRINPLFVNLDEDPAEELIGLFGYSKYNLSLCVFKQVGADWQLLYIKTFDLYNEEQELCLANVFSPNKVFYVRTLYARGTCTYSNGYQFYKLIKGRVYPCLELLNEASSCARDSSLGQEVTANLRFNSTRADEIWVRYNYKFFDTKLIGESNYMEVPLIKNDGGVNCVWDSVSHKYKLEFGAEPNDLNKSKLSHLALVVNDKKFIQDFAYEIKQTMQNGSNEQKALLRKYLAYVNKEK